MSAQQHKISPKLGEGIYLVKDVAKILQLDYGRVRRWIVGYWGGSLQEDYDYTFGDVGNKAINFYSLIEFYTFFKLREKKVSATEIRKLHNRLSQQLNTPYPFAVAQDYWVDHRQGKRFVYYDYLNSLIKFDAKKLQFSLRFTEAFLDKIEFDESNLARRFYPLANSKNVVVDPLHQFGQPVIVGTNIKTQTIFSLYKGGEPNENICNLYNLTLDKVQDAIKFHNLAA